MSSAVFLLVLLAAALHAVWNALVKGSADKSVAMLAVIIGTTPFGLVAMAVSPWPAPASWGWIVGGAAIHCVYQFFLIAAYRVGDLSAVYPIARGSAPLWVALVTTIGLGVALPFGTLAGIATIAAGLLAFASLRGQSAMIAYALATGVAIASYSIVDGLGARAAGTALGFYGAETVLNTLMVVAVLAVRGSDLVARTIRTAPKTIVLGGGASFTAYAIVVWAFTQAPIAAVTALRETSVVFAVLIAIVWLGEPATLRRVAAIALTVCGALVLRLAST